MKKIQLSICFLFLVTLMGYSQASPEKKTGNEWHAAGDAIPRSKEFADNLTKSLALDETTSKKVFQTYLANTKSVDEIKFGDGSDAAKKEALKINADAFSEKMKQLLSPEQFTKYVRSTTKKP